MANVSNDLTTLDFNSIKNNLKEYLKSQSIFQDYDFEASNINVLLDVLAYNTNLNAFYLNMISNEMFLDTALMRDSIVSHAKELNYLPRSFRSAFARVNLYLYDNTEDATVLIPRGTTFTGSDGSRNFTFTTSQNIQALSTNQYGSNINFIAEDVYIYEGDYVSDSYVVSSQNPSRYICNNKTIDTNSLIVTVIEDNGAVVLQYLKGDSLFGLDAQSQVFFIQPAENDTYEILFGDGVIGRPPKENSVVLIEYRACNGELPNGIKSFTADDNIGSAIVRSVETLVDQSTKEVIGRAVGGSLPESLTSIKLNAPRAFTTQERVVTAQDYSTLLKANFSEINDVNAFGGEEAFPPQYGKVIIAVDLKQTDDLPQRFIDTYREFIRPRSPLSIEPVFVKPDYTYVSIETKVKYNINQTSLNIDDIKSLVISSINEYNSTELNGFGKTLRYSRLVAAIDNSQISIVGNNTDVLATKFITAVPGVVENYRLSFNFPLINNIGQKIESHSSEQISVVKSSPFKFQGFDCFIEDNGAGKLQIVRETELQHEKITEIGEVNYEDGSMIIENINFQEVYGGILTVSVRPRDRDIASSKQSILRILNSDININVEQVRI